MRQTSGLVELFDVVTQSGSPFENRRGYALAKALVAEGILEKSLKKPPVSEASRRDYERRIAWWIADIQEKEKKGRRRRKRPPR